MELEKFILKKYGSWSAASLPHHWETVETLDDNGNLVIPGGVVVSESSVHFYPNKPGSGEDVVELTSFPVPISNVEYEQRLNEKKSNIVTLNERYLIDYLRETSIYGKTREVENSFVSISDTR
jgi:hypothetical protein